MSDRSSRTKARPRRGWGLLAGLATLAVVAVPAFWSAAFAMWSFSGCFLECRDPEPAVGLLWAAAALALLAVPVLVGTAVAGVRSRWGWLALGIGLAVAALGTTAMQRVV